MAQRNRVSRPVKIKDINFFQFILLHTVYTVKIRRSAQCQGFKFLFNKINIKIYVLLNKAYIGPTRVTLSICFTAYTVKFRGSTQVDFYYSPCTLYDRRQINLCFRKYPLTLVEGVVGLWRGGGGEG